MSSAATFSKPLEKPDPLTAHTHTSEISKNTKTKKNLDVTNNSSRDDTTFLNYLNITLQTRHKVNAPLGLSLNDH